MQQPPRDESIPPLAVLDETVNIIPLLKKLNPINVLRNPAAVTADEVGDAISQIFQHKLSTVQTSILLYSLAVTGLEQRPDILARCAGVMRAAAQSVDVARVQELVQNRGMAHGAYKGGLCDIVGTGGDFHSTFNISTTSSMIASALLVVAKHGNRASTSKSGSADVVMNLKVPESPQLQDVDASALERIYAETNYGFLFAPNFHQGLRPLASLRNQLPTPTIFNLLGPLAHPAEAAIEARVLGVKRQDLIKVFAEALRLEGVSKALVVCGAEDLDEISCAGITNCARLTATSAGLPQIEYFMLTPENFGLSRHALGSVSPGQTAVDNAGILMRMLKNETPSNDPIKEFVLMNTAALLVISGVCDGDTSPFKDGRPVIREVGPAGGRWKEGVRLAKQALESGRSLEMLKKFVSITNELASKP